MRVEVMKMLSGSSCSRSGLSEWRQHVQKLGRIESRATATTPASAVASVAALTVVVYVVRCCHLKSHRLDCYPFNHIPQSHISNLLY